MSFCQMSFCQISFCQMSFCQMSFCQMSFCQMSFVKCNLAIWSLKNVILTFSLLIKVCKKKLGSFIFEVLKLNFDKFVLWLMLIYFPVWGGVSPLSGGCEPVGFPLLLFNKYWKRAVFSSFISVGNMFVSSVKWHIFYAKIIVFFFVYKNKFSIVTRWTLCEAWTRKRREDKGRRQYFPKLSSTLLPSLSNHTVDTTGIG